MSIVPLVQISDYLVPHGSTDRIQTQHQVAVLSNGNIVFSWEDSVEVVDTGYHHSARYRVFSPGGVALTDEIQANSFSNGGQTRPTVASLADGGFVMVWKSSGQHAEFGHALYGQRFDSTGAAVGGEFRVSDAIDMNEYEPTVEGLADGGFVVSWKKIFDRDENDGVDNFEIFQRRFDAAGQVVSDPEPVSQTSAGVGRSDPQIQSLPDGGWVSVWWEFDAGILQARYDAAGDRVGDVAQVNAPPAPDEPDSTWAKRVDPAIALLADGGWIVAWEGSFQDGPVVEYDTDSDIYFQRFAADGTKVGAQRRANPYEPGEQTDPEVIGLPDGGWIIVWTDEAVPFGDGSGGFHLVDRFVRAQRFSAQGEPLGDAVDIDDPTAGLQHSPQIAGLADGTLLLSWYAFDHLAPDSRADIVAANFAVPYFWTVPEDGPALDLALIGGGAGGREILSVDSTGTIGVVTVRPDGSGFSFDPNGQFEGLGLRETATDSFILTVSDGAGGSVTEAVTIVVTGSNDAPTAHDDTLTISADAPAGLIEVTRNDTDPDTGDDLEVLQASVDTTGTLGVVEIRPDHDTLSYDPAGAFDGLRAGESATDTFSYVVKDGNGGQDGATVTVTITGVNDAPVATAGSVRLDEDTPHAGSVAGNVTDAEGDALTFVLAQDVTAGSLAFAADGGYIYTPDADFHGIDSFRYSVTDADGATASARVTLTVDPVNDAPTGVPELTGVARVGEELRVDASGIDDGDGLGEFSYRWYADGAAIPGATGTRLTIGKAHYGRVISVDVSWTDLGGRSETVSSATPGPVLGPLIEGSDGNDTLAGTELADEINGGGGNDSLVGGAGDDLLKGATGKDKLAGGRGQDELKGGSGKDRLYGGADDDSLIGGAGKDLLAGGTGDDLLTGGAQADTFLFKTGWGLDTITDFDAAGRKSDTLDLTRLLSVRNWKDLTKRHLEVDGNDIVIDGKNGDVIVLRNVDLADLDEGDFLF